MTVATIVPATALLYSLKGDIRGHLALTTRTESIKEAP